MAYNRGNYPHGTVGDRMRLQDLMVLVNQGASFAEICEKIGYSNESAARRAIQRARKKISLPDRKYGVEIEFFGITREEAVEALRTAGIDVQSEGYNHNTVSYWKLVGDASVSGTGLELVSPPLSGIDGLATVEVAMDALRNAGGRTDRTCGLHVHLDFNNNTADEIIRFAGMYADRQDAFDLVVSASRRGTRNQWCQPTTPNEVERAAAALRSRAGINMNRYRKINLMSYAKYGTVEVRHHQGTLNPTKAVAWIRLLLAFAEAAVANMPLPLSLAGMLHHLTKGAGLYLVAAEFLSRRAVRDFGFADRIGSADDPCHEGPVRPDEPEPTCTCDFCGTSSRAF